jgi:hypothetical protein
MNKVIKIAALIIIFAGLLFAAYKIFFQPEKKEGSDIIKAEEQAADQDTGKPLYPSRSSKPKEVICR